MAPPLCGARGRWRRTPRGLGKTASRGREARRREEEARKEFERNVVLPRATLSSRVTGTRRESAYNERALSVCALLFTCLRARYARVASHRIASHRVSRRRVQPSTLSTDAPPLSLSLLLSVSFLLFPGNRSRRARCVRERADVCAGGGCVVAHERGWMGEYTRLPVRA